MASIEKQAEKRWVIKIDSSLVTDGGKGLDYKVLACWANEMASLHRLDMEIIVVSSGAVAEGMSRLGWSTRPHDIPTLQAAAAVGQMGLMEAYEASFRRSGICAAQMLLTREDFATRQRYLNTQATLNKLVKMRAIPVINENDTVSTEEICFGNNDMLAALIGNMVGADRLVILTDQPGLFVSDPRVDSRAALISLASADDDSLLDVAGGAGKSGKGGMLSKIKSARMFALSGGTTTIASGHINGVLEKIRSGLAVGTELRPRPKVDQDVERWIVESKSTLICESPMH